MDDYLAKPIKSETLLRVPDALVAAGRTLRGASPPPRDLGIALGRVGGNRELLAELAELFVEDYPAKIADVRASLDAKDARRGQRVVHNFKGGLATLGARRCRRPPDGSRQYDVDVLGRIVRVADSAGATLCDIQYDALGRVASLNEGGVARVFLHFGTVVWQEDVGGAPARQYSPHPLSLAPLAIHTSGKSYVPLLDGRLNVAAYADSAGAVAERYRYEPFGRPSIFSPTGSARATSAIGLEPSFGLLRYVPSTGLYLSRQRWMDPVHGMLLSPDPSSYQDSPFLYGYAVGNPVDYVDVDGDLVFLPILGIMAVGALVAAALNAIRQRILMSEDSNKKFDFNELLCSAAIGGALAPALVVAPELAVPLAATGVVSGISEWNQGHTATATFDIVTSVLPMAAKGPRSTIFGPGTRFGQMIGRGPSAPWSVRFARLGPRPNRSTHFTTDEYLRSIEVTGMIRGSVAQPWKGIHVDGKGRGVWVAPWRANQMTPWRRLMIGGRGLNTKGHWWLDKKNQGDFRSFVEFGTQPGELTRPGIKFIWSRLQRRIPGDVDLAGRNPRFGKEIELQPEGLGTLWPWLDSGMGRRLHDLIRPEADSSEQNLRPITPVRLGIVPFTPPRTSSTCPSETVSPDAAGKK